MRPWPSLVKVEQREGEPLFLAIARSIRDDIRRGRFVREAAVPSSRDLAKTLGVHRNTVLAAYRELLAEGWLETRAARGTFVSRELPDTSEATVTRARGKRVHDAPNVAAPGHEALGFTLPRFYVPDAPLPDPPGAISLSGGVPDTRLVPHDVLARALRRAMRARQRLPRARDPLGYGAAAGQPRLRRALASMLREARGIAAHEDALLVTRGSQMALDLFARAMLEPGDVVAVEHLGYRQAWSAFRLARAELVPIPVDDEGLDTSALAALVKKRRVRAVYVTPHHQYPTTVTMSAARRMELLALAARHGIAVIEDDYDHEFHYRGRPVLPLASADSAGVVVYVGTLSKVLAPGVRLGFCAGPRALIDRMTRLRAVCDRQGDHVLEHAVAELIEDGDLARHVRKARRVYAARAEAMAARLVKAFAERLIFEAPRGGTAVWATVAPEIDLDAWVKRAREGGVLLHSARRFAFDESVAPHAIRVGFAHLSDVECAEAIRRLASSVPRL